MVVACDDVELLNPDNTASIDLLVRLARVEALMAAVKTKLPKQNVRCVLSPCLCACAHDGWLVCLFSTPAWTETPPVPRQLARVHARVLKSATKIWCRVCSACW